MLVRPSKQPYKTSNPYILHFLLSHPPCSHKPHCFYNLLLIWLPSCINNQSCLQILPDIILLQVINWTKYCCNLLLLREGCGFN
ncbi:hypothetical protein L1987_86442 [Smallanthus sonchifolius]|uniref:Uncharacterized protein n=1 Tax=Smallanthus sonchifolius TaxID=185202 RepID=A0ACB8Y021_9ASTR|nr:hypothetical protein L1987_86442 [Smallanthus sonchifolius]